MSANLARISKMVSSIPTPGASREQYTFNQRTSLVFYEPVAEILTWNA
jgi:hypothetical protein